MEPEDTGSRGIAPGCRLVRTSFGDIRGFADDDLVAAWRVFQASARAVLADTPVLRDAVETPRWLADIAARVADDPGPRTQAEALRRSEDLFTPHWIVPSGAAPPGMAPGGFLTGYYEPVVPGSAERTASFTAPVLARPADWRRLGPGTAEHPYPPRDAIEAAAERGGFAAIAWLRDPIEVFMIQVQGSGRVRLEDGRSLRLVYDGRNGQPYTSIGRVLVEEGHVHAHDMSLDRLKGWVRAHGQGQGEPGRALMARNRSYVFFRAEPDRGGEGPTGGQGLPLTALRSIAVDRGIWPYGLPFWIEAEMPWAGPTPSRFARLLVAQDTGSAILGPARADLFFGSGEEAGRRAGAIRHSARMAVLLPRGAP